MQIIIIKHFTCILILVRKGKGILTKYAHPSDAPDEISVCCCWKTTPVTLLLASDPPVATFRMLGEAILLFAVNMKRKRSVERKRQINNTITKWYIKSLPFLSGYFWKLLTSHSLFYLDDMYMDFILTHWLIHWSLLPHTVTLKLC